MTIDWSLPYASTREAVCASQIVATSQPLAAQAGLEMLAEGGNAVDAAIATAITLTVVEPCSNGIGGDAFAIVKDQNGLHGLNASGKSPALMPNSFNKSIPSVGWFPITVPGAVSAWVALSEKFGLLPFDRLFNPAIRYACNGFLLSRQTAESFANSLAKYEKCEEWRKTFLVDGKVPNTGDRITLPNHASTLDEIAKSKGQSFYQGNLANKIDAESQVAGGLLRKSDLSSHQCEWVKPLTINVGGHAFSELPPNGQGLAALIAMRILQIADVDMSNCDTPYVLHMQIEAMKRAFADTHAYVADPEFCDQGQELLEESRIEQHVASITEEASETHANTLPRYSSTVYVAAGDAKGIQVSFIQSNFEGFGSGIVIPDTGIAMQNRGRGFLIEQGHPNCIGPNKRPFHTIIPAFIELAEGGNVPFGVMGGPMQPQGHVQVACRMLFAGQNPQAALDAPRWRLSSGFKVHLEPGFADSAQNALLKMGHDIQFADKRSVAFGGGQVVYQLKEGYIGASDQRRDGQAVGV